MSCAAGSGGIPNEREVERRARIPPAAVEGVEQRLPEDARPPVVEVGIPVPFLDVRSQKGRIGHASRRLVMPQRGATVVHEASASRPEVQAEVDVLKAIVITGPEPLDRIERLLPDEQTGGGQGGPIGDLRRRAAEGGSSPEPITRGNGHRLGAVEVDAGMLEPEVREACTATLASATRRIDEPGTDRGCIHGGQGLDHVPEPIRRDGFDVVVEETQELTAGHGRRLGVGVGEGGVLLVADHPQRERHLEPLEDLDRTIGRAVVDDDDLDVLVLLLRASDGGKTLLQEQKPVAVEDDDRHEGPVLDLGRREIPADGRREGALGIRAIAVRQLWVPRDRVRAGGSRLPRVGVSPPACASPTIRRVRSERASATRTTRRARNCSSFSRVLRSRSICRSRAATASRRSPASGRGRVRAVGPASSSAIRSVVQPPLEPSGASSR